MSSFVKVILRNNRELLQQAENQSVIVNRGKIK